MGRGNDVTLRVLSNYSFKNLFVVLSAVMLVVLVAFLLAFLVWPLLILSLRTANRDSLIVISREHTAYFHVCVS